jgi:hypothetical protein
MLPCYHQIAFFVQEAKERARLHKFEVVKQASRLQEKYEKQNYEFFKEDKIAL